MEQLFYLLILWSVISAASEELLFGLIKACKVPKHKAVPFLLNYQIFLGKVESSFYRTSTSSDYVRELCRELETPALWQLMLVCDKSISKEWELARHVAERAIGTSVSEECSMWLDRLLGDKLFEYSYLELLVKVLSARGKLEITDLSHQKMIFITSEFRRMSLEREYIYKQRNEELHEIYSLALFLYTHMVNEVVGLAMRRNVQEYAFNLTFIYFPKEILGSAVETRKAPINLGFIAKYINPKHDFMKFGGRLNLKKTTNFARVYSIWLEFINFVPNKFVRKKYFDEEETDLIKNIRRLESHTLGLLGRSKNIRLENVDALICVSLAFDLVEALVAYEGRRFSVLHLKKLLIAVFQNYEEINNLKRS